VKQETLVVDLVDPQWKKAVWWGVADEVLTDKCDKDLSMVRQRTS
jgi:hypothetical protein